MPSQIHGHQQPKVGDGKVFDAGHQTGSRKMLTGKRQMNQSDFIYNSPVTIPTHIVTWTQGHLLPT